MTAWRYETSLLALKNVFQHPHIIALIFSPFSADRHQSIVQPFGMRITRFQGKLIILMIWLTALLLALPILGVMNFVSSPNGERCEESWPTGFPYAEIYLLCSFALTYAIPLPVMIIIYIKIGLKLRQATKEGGDRPGFTQAQATKRIIKMLSAVVICYALCFLPFHTFYFMFDAGEFQSRQVRITSSHHVYVLECFTLPQKNPLPPKTAEVPNRPYSRWPPCRGFAIIMQISYTLLRGQTTQVREVITNTLATQMICFTFIECLSPKQ